MYKIIMLILCSISYSIGLAQQYKLDSVVYANRDRKIVRTYQEEKNSSRTDIISYVLNEMGSQIEEKSSYLEKYDDTRNPIVSMKLEWNFVKNVWDTVSKTESKYDMEGRMIHSASFEKLDMKWIKNFELVNTYNADSIINIVYRLKFGLFLPDEKYYISLLGSRHDIEGGDNHKGYIWDKEAESWKTYSRSEPLFLNDSILVGYVRYTGKDNLWLNEQKVIYELDKEGNRTENYITYKGIDNGWILDQRFVDSDSIVDGKKRYISSVYTWNEADKKWILTSDYRISKNEKGMDLETVSYEYNEERNQLQLSYQKMFEYNSKDDIKLDQSLIYEDNILSRGFQTTYEYDNERNLMSQTIFILDIASNTWIEFTKTEYSYIKATIANDESKEAVPDTSDYEYNLKQIKEYEFIEGKMVLKEESVYFYSNVE